MKKKWLLFISFTFLAGALLAQHGIRHNLGGSGVCIQPKPDESCLPPTYRDIISQKLARNKDLLVSQGILSDHRRGGPVTFDWPLKPTAEMPFFDYWSLTQNVDQDETGGIEDYKCLDRTYDGHRGTDFILWPWPWYMVANDMVEVVAAADGIIIGKDDGFKDDNCDCSSFFWNAVYVEHADGSEAWYGHLKDSSLTTKEIGMAVSKGEYLGIVASSGCSFVPHLHFEVFDSEDSLVDPFEGPCNDLNTSSWWTEQPDYLSPNINALETHSSFPDLGCPDSLETPYWEDCFAGGSPLYFFRFHRDISFGDTVFLRVIDADTEVWSSWMSIHFSDYSPTWYYYDYGVLPLIGPFGNWTWEVVYKGDTLTHEFEVKDADCFPPGTNTWIGPPGGKWHGAGAFWSLGHIPKYCESVIIPDGSNLKVESTKTAECYTIDISEGAEFRTEEGAILKVQIEDEG